MADNLCRFYPINRIFFDPRILWILLCINSWGNDSENQANRSKTNRLRQIYDLDNECGGNAVQNLTEKAERGWDFSR